MTNLSQKFKERELVKLPFRAVPFPGFAPRIQTSPQYSDTSILSTRDRVHSNTELQTESSRKMMDISELSTETSTRLQRHTSSSCFTDGYAIPDRHLLVRSNTSSHGQGKKCLDALETLVRSERCRQMARKSWNKWISSIQCHRRARRMSQYYKDTLIMKAFLAVKFHAASQARYRQSKRRARYHYSKSQRSKVHTHHIRIQIVPINIYVSIFKLGRCGMANARRLTTTFT